MQRLLNRQIGWSAMTAGNDMARIIDTCYTEAGIRQYGLPSANHWEKVVVRPHSLTLSYAVHALLCPYWMSCVECMCFIGLQRNTLTPNHDRDFATLSLALSILQGSLYGNVLHDEMHYAPGPCFLPRA